MSKEKVFVVCDDKDKRRYENIFSAWGKDSDFEFVFNDLPSHEMASLNNCHGQEYLAEKIRQVNYTLVIIGNNDDETDSRAEQIGYQNWIDYAIARSRKFGNEIIAVKIDESYTIPKELRGQSVEWAKRFTKRSVISALENSTAEITGTERFDRLYRHYENIVPDLRNNARIRYRYFFFTLILEMLKVLTVFFPGDAILAFKSFLFEALRIPTNVDLEIIEMLLTFAIVLLLVRYLQIVVITERQYTYILKLEEKINRIAGEQLITHQGEFYTVARPKILILHRRLYNFIAPLIFLLLAVLELGRNFISPTLSPLGTIAQVINGLFLFIVIIFLLVFWIHLYNARDIRPEEKRSSQNPFLYVKDRLKWILLIIMICSLIGYIAGDTYYNVHKKYEATQKVKILTNSQIVPKSQEDDSKETLNNLFAFFNHALHADVRISQNYEERSIDINVFHIDDDKAKQVAAMWGQLLVKDYIKIVGEASYSKAELQGDSTPRLVSTDRLINIGIGIGFFILVGFLGVTVFLPNRNPASDS